MEKTSTPVAELGIISLAGTEKFTASVDSYLKKWRRSNKERIIESECPRFGTGEAKAHLLKSVRGKDIYIIVDVTDFSVHYTVRGEQNHMSPDDHFQNLKRIISAINGKGHRITVIMPFLYESRQHKRNSRESLDCALALRELENLGVSTIITFDAHDTRVQNALLTLNFESVSPVYQFVKQVVDTAPEIILDAEHTMVISPDEGATSRAIYLSSCLGLNMGMCYKRRNFTKIVDGCNPIIAHEFLGSDLNGKDCIVIDDMISSGSSVIEVAKQLKERGANRVIIFSTFGLFTNGFSKFDMAYKDGIIYRVFATNLIYQPEELFTKEWYITVPMQEYVAALIDNLNCDKSISSLISPANKIEELMEMYKV